jgi:hypothetical protein
MTQLTLIWDDTDSYGGDPNITAQRASYRYKTIGGSWITSGFTPANDLDVDVTTVQPPEIEDNKVVEYKVEAICTLNGPTINDNGIQEGIGFACITPDVSDFTPTEATITIDLTDTDITKVRFTLKKSSDNSVIMTPTVVDRLSNSATITKTGLTGSTSYYWQVELYANINSFEVKSSDSGYLGQPCSPYPFTTEEEIICDALTAATVSSIEIP